MNHWIDIETAHGPIRGWRCDPAGPSRGAVVVIQEIFGLNAHVRSVAERVASEGFVAVAPALFDPLERGLELDYDDAGTQRGRELRRELGADRAIDLVAATAHLLERGGLRTGTMGFCWGGTIALLANTRLGLPAVSYYGGQSVPFLDEPLRAPMMFHFGQRDPIIRPEHVALHRSKHPGAIIHEYPAGHGFNCDQRSDHDPASATLAWTRTIDFFSEALR